MAKNKEAEKQKYIKQYTGMDVNDLKNIRNSLSMLIGEPQHESSTLRISVINEILKDVKDEVSNKKKPSDDIEDMPEDFSYAVGYANKVRNANKRNIPFELTFDEYKKIASVKRCYYTGKRFSSDGANYKTLDRIESDKGYTKSNTVACCHAVNQLKNDMFENKLGAKMTVKQAQLFFSKIKS